LVFRSEQKSQRTQERALKKGHRGKDNNEVIIELGVRIVQKIETKIEMRVQ
jgi:hypothetical protein